MKAPVFLDWDGVLVDSLALYFDLFRNLCEQYQKDFPISTVAEFRDWYEPNWELNFEELGFTSLQYQQICSTYPSTLDYGAASFFLGVKELIEELSSKHPLVVVSTAPTANIKERLSSSGLLNHFDLVTGSDDGSTDKANRIGQLLSQYEGAVGVMVGDTDLDIEAGKINGMKTIGVTYGWLSESRVRKAEPNFIVTQPTSLQQTVEEALAEN